MGGRPLGRQIENPQPGGLGVASVLGLIVGLIVVALTPAINGLSRYREQEADRCGLELVHGIVPNVGETRPKPFKRLPRVAFQTRPRPNS